MPVVVSRHFDDSLASWQPPERFLAPLAHSLSPDAPSGSVEVLAHLAEPLPTSVTHPPVEHAHGGNQPELVLAVPPVAHAPHREPVMTSRRIDQFFESPQTDAEPPTPHEPTVATVAEALRPPVDTPDSTPPVPVHKPLLDAPAPPDMPLPRLTATERLPASGETAPATSGGPVNQSAEGASRPVAQRELDVAVSREPLAVAAPMGAEPTDETVGELPLAAPGGTTRPAEQTRATGTRDSTDAATVYRLSEAEAPLSAPEPEHTESAHPEGRGRTPAGDETAAGQESPPPGPVAVPDAGGKEAPLLGDAPSLVRDTASIQPTTASADTPSPSVEPGPERSLAAPTTRRRAGIGEPMSGLPPTSMSWDVTTMTASQQRQTSRALVQSQLAKTAALAQRTPEGPARSRHEVSSPAPSVAESVPEPVLAGAELPVVGYQKLRSTMAGTVPPDIAPASDEAVPLLSPTRFTEAETREASPSDSGASLEGRGARSFVGSRYGMDLSAVPVDRSPESAGEARNMRARAFTSDRSVVVPRSAGTLESGTGEALLAHELTHVAQRARFGANLPAESTPAGRVLEAEALAVEMSFPSSTHRAAPLMRTEPQVGTAVSRGVTPGAAEPPPAELPLASSSGAVLDADALAATLIERMSTVTSPGSPGTTETYTAAWAPAPTAAPAAQFVQRAEDSPTAVVPAPTTTPDATSGQQPSTSLERPSDEELTKWSQWLYPLIRYRLKGELREDRERAGLLTDHYRRW
ncbi:MAG TPA: DUF4157 domain-containing protein [Acidimicrobiales bacterium]|nr:DUF4157 domain-containing protein [Acidimicrobiales bacterium]